jgi:hypothetical protein
MRRLLERWLPGDSYLALRLWFPQQSLVARFYHPQRTTANSGLALSISWATAAPHRSLGQSGSAALDDLHLQFGCQVGDQTSGICGS